MNVPTVIARLVNYSGSRFLFSGVSVLTLATHLYGQTAPVVAGPEVQTVIAARQVLDQFFDLRIEAIPPAMLQSSSGVAIFPNMVKGGFILGVNYGI